ncbi:TPA: hypothetical protein DEP90_02210 [Patescibacteria group bacterium]|nr:hypothetical protein [Patescibacteria group bacterium]
MYKRVRIKKLGKKTSHRDALIKNQLRTLFTAGVLRTTTPKAKVMKSKAESLLSKMNRKEISLENRRRLQTVLGNPELVKKAIEYSKKAGASVRIIKTGFRAGDNAQMSKLELIGFKTKKSVKKVVKEKEEVKDEVSKKIIKGIEKKDIKKVSSKRVRTVKKERARSRSGLS